MAAPHGAVTGPPPGVRLDWLRAAPALAVLAFALPIGAGLLGTVLPAFGYLPAIGAQQWGLHEWRRLFEQPGLLTSIWLTLLTGWLSTVLAVVLATGLAAFIQHRPGSRRLGEWIAPVLAMPHSALAIGFAFLIAPSGWLVRLVSPGLTGWATPPDAITVGHPWGLAMVAGLLLKEVPYLLLMTLGALAQVAAPAQTAAARMLGYDPAQAYIKVVLPQVYRQLRLPIFAVLAFSLSTVDVALILGPGNPPTLAVMAVRWFSAPDVQWYGPAAAAALLLLLLVAGSLLAWHGLERALGRVGRRWVERGGRGPGPAAAAAASASVVGVLLMLTAALLLALLLWSFAQQWRYPSAWPQAWTWQNWQRQLPSASAAALTTLLLGGLATAVALVLTLACLENEAARPGPAQPARAGAKPQAGSWLERSGAAGQRVLWLLYLPLLVPQVAFLFGVQVLLVHTGLDASYFSVVWMHLIFVLPYLFLSLADPWRAFDVRYARTATSLGAKRWRVFWRIKLPILMKPLLIACAVAFAVSVGQYLPTLFAGSGRIGTLTTEAVTLASGEDRRVTAAWALLQAGLPFAVYALAALLPRWLFAGRRGMA